MRKTIYSESRADHEKYAFGRFSTFMSRVLEAELVGSSTINAGKGWETTHHMEEEGVTVRYDSQESRRGDAVRVTLYGRENSVMIAERKILTGLEKISVGKLDAILRGKAQVS